jgi:hypothetical protein
LNSAFGEWHVRFVKRVMAAIMLPLAP